MYGQWRSITPSGRRSARLRSAWHQLSASWGRCRWGAGAAHSVGIWCGYGAAGTTGWRRRRCGLGQKSRFGEKPAEAVHGDTSSEERVLLAAPRRGAADYSNLCGLMQSRVARLLQCARPRRGSWQCKLYVARQPFSSRQLRCLRRSLFWSCACARGAHELLRLARDAKRRTVDTHAIAMIRSASRLCKRSASTNTPRRITFDSLHRDCASLSLVPAEQCCVQPHINEQLNADRDV